MKKYLSIIIIEDDELTRLTLRKKLEHFSQARIVEARSKQEAMSFLKSDFFDLAFVDLDLETELAGLQLIESLTKRNVYSVVVSGREEESVIELAYQNGCSDYLQKPYSGQVITKIMDKFLRKSSNISNEITKALLINPAHSQDFSLDIIEQAIYGEHPIFIRGESGTGKTHLAKFIHQMINPNAPFVHLNCSEISESLFESELFGHVKGSFTGALKDKKGLLELAHNGLLFLDEIGTLSLRAQGKLLKAIEEKTFFPVGASRPVRSNFRLITATCENLALKVQDGTFREDFYYRIEGFNLHLKSMKERKNDIAYVLQHFLNQSERKIVLSSAAKNLLIQYEWPGNVREIQKVAMLLRGNEKGIIQASDLEGFLRNNLSRSSHWSPDFNRVTEIGLGAYIAEIEEIIFNEVLSRNEQKVRKTLTDLKISNNTFYRLRQKLGDT